MLIFASPGWPSLRIDFEGSFKGGKRKQYATNYDHALVLLYVYCHRNIKMTPRGAQLPLFSVPLGDDIRRLLFKILNDHHPISDQPKVIVDLFRQIAPIEHVFVTYGGTTAFTEHYLHRDSRFWATKTELFALGLYNQQGHWGVKVGIAAGPGDLSGQPGAFLSRTIHDKTKDFAAENGLHTYSFAGILPGIMHRSRIRRESHERTSTALAVASAAIGILENDLPSEAPVVIVGARGFIGRKLSQALSGRRVIDIDRVLGSQSGEMPDEPSLVINVASPDAMSGFGQLISENSVLLNEVYPPPSASAVSEFVERKISVRHIAGVAGAAWPAFPFPYATGIPCCAAIPGAKIEPVVVELKE